MTKNDVKLIQQAIGVTVDGKLGPVTISELQRRLAVKVDGKLGPVTISALQRRLGVTVDGKLGPITEAALRKSGAAVLSATGAFVVPPGMDRGPSSIGTVRFDLKKLAIAGLGIAAAGLFAMATRSGRRYA
jgi:peptidoglycan hydrolase-like protein with peptidoglycan-binding domain